MDKENLIKYFSLQKEKYTSFLNYDWNNCEKWKLFFLNIYPTPNSTDQILQLRKKFYKRNIDNDFDINLTQNDLFSNVYSNDIKKDNKFKSSNKDKDKDNSNTKNSNENILNAEKPLIQTMLYSISAFLWVISMLNYFTSLSYLSINIPILASFLRVFIEIGHPFRKDFLSDILKEDSFHCLLYCLFVLGSDSLNHVLLFPVVLKSLLYISKFCKNHLKIMKFIKWLTNKVLYREAIIISMIAHSYVYIGFMLFLGLLLNINQGYIIIIHWIFLIFMNRHSYDVKKVFKEIDSAIIKVKNGKHTPKFLSNLYSAILNLCYKFN